MRQHVRPRRAGAVIAVLALAGALTAVIVSPGSAQTNAKRTRISVTGKLSGVGSPGYALPPGPSFGGEENGVLSNLGRVAYHVEGTFAKKSGRFVLDGTSIIVTNNGRGLVGNFHGTTQTGRHPQATIHITGGSGRFKNAHGTLTVKGNNTPTPGAAFPNRMADKITGHIKF